MCRGFDPLFSLWQDRARSFWGIFLIHQQQSYLLGYKNYQFLQKSIFLAPNSIFSSMFLGPIFSGQRHTPISFQAEYPPRDSTLVWANTMLLCLAHALLDHQLPLLSGVPDYFGRNKISSGGDLSHYSSASLY